MRKREFVQAESQPFRDLEALLESRVFHVTRRQNMQAILCSGALLPNADGQFETTFGSSANSFFRLIGCVSVFDYRMQEVPNIAEYRGRCYPFQAARPGGAGIAILMLKPESYQELLPWTEWSSSGDLSQNIVPYVEAGYPGPLPLSMIDEVLFVRITEDPDCFAALVRRSYLGD
ncbi:hypothetical protein [Stenotrophomonas sp. GZD-301]|uniref:hypothetical protein n=1 Tax=Stenotrophomonas sp. GZD-301 TaxID=3404814 RepID=UPI003BB75D5B